MEPPTIIRGALSTKGTAKARAARNIPAHRDPMQPLAGRCNAQRENKSYCHRFPLKDRTRCKRHGGRQGTGPENSNWRGGTTQPWIRKHLPAGMLKKFDSIINDPDLISMRSAMAINGVRLSDLLARLPAGESRLVLSQLRGIMDQQHSILTTLRLSPGLTEAQHKTLDNVTENLDQGLRLCGEAAKTSAVWDEITTVLEGHRRLADTERRREEAMMQSITMPQAIALFNAIFKLINTTVRSEDERTAISTGLKKLLEHNSEPAEMVS